MGLLSMVCMGKGCILILKQNTDLVFSQISHCWYWRENAFALRRKRLLFTLSKRTRVDETDRTF